MISFILALLLTPSTALHADEAGLTDFLLRTPGHGLHGVRYAQTLNGAWVTSESGPSIADAGGCHVAARNVTDGSVLWRIDACSSPNGKHATLVHDEIIHTLDDEGILRGWNMDGLQWDADVGNEGYAARILGAKRTQAIVGAVTSSGDDEKLMLYHSTTGQGVTNEALSAKQLLQNAKVKSSKGRIIDLVAMNGKIGIISGYYANNELYLSSMAYSEFDENSVDGSVPIKLSGDSVSILASSVRVFMYKDKVYIVGIEKNSKIAVAAFNSSGKGSARVFSIDEMRMSRLTTVAVDVSTDSGQVLRISGLDGLSRRESVAIVGEDRDGGIKLDDISFDNVEALAYCSDMNAVLAVSTEKDGTSRMSSFDASNRNTWSPRSVAGDVVLTPPSHERSKGDLVEGAHLADCNANSMTVIFTTKGGLTTAVHLENNGSSLMLKQRWSTEEALSSISSAVFLDETHAISGSSDESVNADEEEEKALKNLQFTQRIQSQLITLKNLFFGSGLFSSLASMALMSEEKKAERNHHFGFAKLSVLLSENMHRIIVLDTARKGEVVWAMNLNHDATMHKIVHGGQSLSLNDPHGYGGVHDHELLVLSHIPSKSSIEWKCFDGVTGKVFSNDAVEVSSKVTQIVPLRSSHHSSHDSSSCRQVALVIHEDDSVSLIPDSGRSYATVDEALSTVGKTGLFVHTVNKKTGEFRAMRVLKRLNSALETNLKPYELVDVGKAFFDPAYEKIVNVAYPQRGEVIQSPSMVLGDDSLLLKYLNPHLVVVVTEATKSFLAEVSSESSEQDSSVEKSFHKALSTGDSSSTGQKRKPLGASKPGEASPVVTNTIVPSLFITLIDSVSGQILHRVSHAHASEVDVTDNTQTNVPVVISENWVVYSFFNQRTRRTDIGVLTLHDGMIDKNGLTAFNNPEQELVFSSLESAKPIVLSKTFGLAKAVSAIGVTVTKAGISSKQFLFATGNEQVISMDRRLMDPRRPNGELKISEKMEGLTKYAPLLPIIPLLTPSHVYEVSNVQSILSTTANIESQSLILAYGTDIFFTRLAPSKGFDLLPDNFNRGLLTMVVLGMTFVLVSLQRVNKKKTTKTTWM